MGWRIGVAGGLLALLVLGILSQGLYAIEPGAAMYAWRLNRVTGEVCKIRPPDYKECLR